MAGLADNEFVNPQELSELITAGKEIRDRWGINFLANEYDVLLESAFKETGAPQHTIDHVDCPACQFIDKRMNSDLLGMANQTFSEAAKVWQGVRRNSNTLRDRTHESTGENIIALGKFFNNIQMSSINHSNEFD